ncbi:MAG: TetR family transcriptional regulator [Phycicoccus sp.]
MEQIAHQSPWRDRKRDQTRAAVVDAARALFTAEGFDKVTVERIAERSRIAPRTFFRYFASKDDVVFADDGELHALLTQVLERQPPDVSPLTVAATACYALAAELEPRRAALVQREQLMDQTPSLRARDLAKRARWRDDIAAQLMARRSARHPKPADRDALLVAALSMACWDVAYCLWLRGGRRTLRRELEQAFDALSLHVAPAGG